MSRKSFFQNRHVRYAVPFLLFIVGGSIGLREFTALKYKYRPVESVNPLKEAEKAGIKLRPRHEATLEYQYEELKKIDLNNWENKRIPRPPGWEPETSK